MKKNRTYLFLIFGLISIILMKNNFFKNSYFIITKNFDERFYLAYKKNQFSGYCSKESHGYVRFIKDKFSVVLPPKIINFSEKRMKLPYWIFSSNKNKVNHDQIILLNFQSNINFDFKNYLVKDNFNDQCFFLIKK